MCNNCGEDQDGDYFQCANCCTTANTPCWGPIWTGWDNEGWYTGISYLVWCNKSQTLVSSNRRYRFRRRRWRDLPEKRQKEKKKKQLVFFWEEDIQTKKVKKSFYWKGKNIRKEGEFSKPPQVSKTDYLGYLKSNLLFFKNSLWLRDKLATVG